MQATKMQQISFIDIFKISPTCFGRQIHPSSGALLTVYRAFGTVQCTETAADRWHRWDGTQPARETQNTNKLQSPSNIGLTFTYPTEKMLWFNNIVYHDRKIY
jgi:hypothetical protein